MYFQAEHPHIAEEVMKSIKRQAWYLTQELAILSLFDKEILHEGRRHIADTLLAIPVPAAFAPGKPSFPINILDADSTIASFIGPKSWLLFHLLGQDGAWLRLPVCEWNDSQDYKAMSAVISDLAVVNDTAERSIKDVEEFANYARDGDKRGKIITIADSHRIKCPDFKKALMEINV